VTASLTVIIPAYNEVEGIGETLAALVTQSTPPEAIIVVDDGSTDGTANVARGFERVTVLSPGVNLGSKAKAQNFALDHCSTDLVLPVDADTVLAPDYVELIKGPFSDPRTVIAAGCVLTRFQDTLWERARQMEYLSGFHWFRPVQDHYGAPLVCSGCCSAFRLDALREFGGFPDRTLVEDIDYTWSQQIAGHGAAYVADAVAYAAEPTSRHFMCAQLNRWKTGYFQNVRQHGWNMVRRKPMLALWVAISLVEILLSPLMVALPVWWMADGGSPLVVAAWMASSEVLLFGPSLAYAIRKRKLSVWRVLRCWPSFYILKAFNAYYDFKAIVTELILVPLRLKKSNLVYVKGH
jgi:cellulose synthase/poly-beta-1,6-N-acetylglucosamine synthase-like glycosyltransferase